MWNVRTLYRSGSLTTVARELPRYELDLVGGWDKGGTVRAGDYIFLRKRKRKSSIGSKFFGTPQNGSGS
jgi:hypothetical protein